MKIPPFSQAVPTYVYAHSTTHQQQLTTHHPLLITTTLELYTARVQCLVHLAKSVKSKYSNLFEEKKRD